MHEPIELSLTQAAESLRKDEFSSRELVLACLKQIERLEPGLNAFLYLAAEQALKQADEADKKLAAWKKNASINLPPLTGLPLAVKDVLVVKGMPCTCGSKILHDFHPPYTATAVKRLQQAGMIVIGKTNTDEFAMGSSTENSAYGVTHNPWNTSRVPGGSSGGSAAAVAARMVPAALGTDTGGSIRQPASFCGVTGLKPTYGLISRYGLVAYGSSLDTVGAFGRTAQDVALLFMNMAGRDGLDSTCADIPSPVINLKANAVSATPLQGIRVGVPKEYFIEGMQADVETRIQEAIEVLRSLGAEVLKVSLPHTEYALPVYYLIAPAEASANLARYDGIRYGPRADSQTMRDVFYLTRGQKFGPEVERRIMLGTYALSAGYYDAYYGQAQKVRTLIRRDFENTFAEVDLIAAPCAPTTAFPIGAHGDDPLAMYLEDIFTLPANLAGVPGLAFPVGFDSKNLPVGMQLMGAHFGEELLFRTAHAYQQVTDWHLHSPDQTC